MAVVASPVMIHSIEEIPNFTHHACGLCINVGTISHDWLPAVKLAAIVVNDRSWFLDQSPLWSQGFGNRA
ncbi:hypothetical protein Tsubulata_049078 [Turnera subulata]|uniref:hydroxyethylthiazole kinase n=1 Tax=Turnera subulata TaxID=218843 RepID=A0A9Q0FP65_9ROSI|nr:hypothetical protein Tsubulata_049078 [Turnera subulata]